MDSKTRVIMSLGFEKPDRIAISDAYWPEFQEKCIEELKLNKDINISDFFNNDVYVACPDETPFPLDAAVISESESDIVERNGWGAVVRTKKNAYFYEELSVKIQDKKDIRKVVFDDPGLDMRYLEFEKEVVVEKNKGKCVFGKIGGPFIRTEFLRGQMQYLLDIVEDPEFVKEMAALNQITQLGEYQKAFARDISTAGNLLRPSKPVLTTARIPETQREKSKNEDHVNLTIIVH